ncbi:hypothetical protein J2X12_001783 [Pseudarthrobacter oxydans]|uniref:Uncharacterized protein n=1 Tax=Pseudarthrobacter oxydans TaxID=1671 RepID=A0AAW8N7X7_PSEOX|nr:hypothetical protein [Pseudarthrobacter oxydans]MDR6792882.1 hypothetical protein [Pseudarthrobacter oxydans]MDR7163768.1 hypothetical protein [Pseudarthrobacter oxydans]
MSLLLLPWLLSDQVHVSMIVFIIVYGLDWVATFPPTATLCRSILGHMLLTHWVMDQRAYP